MSNYHCLCFKLPAIATAVLAGIRLGERECHDVLLLVGLVGDPKPAQLVFVKNCSFPLENRFNLTDTPEITKTFNYSVCKNHN